MAELDELREKMKDGLNNLEKGFLELKKDVQWQQRIAILAGAFLLAFFGYTRSSSFQGKSAPL
jgi:hypothetical protein